jgi:murein L,D-transpeptidase YcbB/YkuD
MVKPILKIGFASALALLATAPIHAELVANAAVTASIAAANAPVADNVERYYAANGNRLIWLDKGTGAATLIAERLEHADLDGFGEGPARAAEIRAALASAATPAARLEADKVISKAWTRYVRNLEAPINGVIYGDQRVTPRPKPVERILYDAGRAPSDVGYIRSEAMGNAVYERMRSAAISTYEAKGQRTPGRVLDNLLRVRALPAEGRFVLVDTASQNLMMYENGQLLDQMKVVVGKPQYATPMISSMIYYAALNPYWHVPDHLVRDTIAPRAAKQGEAYMKRQGYEVVSEWNDNARIVPASEVDWKAVAAGTSEAKVRQLPGPTNAMGKIKFYFANGEGIYLHDTPNKELFAKSDRTLSNGCVRLEDAPRLARFLMGGMPSAPESSPEQIVKLDKGVPVFVTYLTVAEQNGQLNYVNDVYNRDGAATAMN